MMINIFYCMVSTTLHGWSHVSHGLCKFFANLCVFRAPVYVNKKNIDEAAK